MKKNKKGFTIVELVIVIAVIGILAAVLIPTFTNVVENSHIAAIKEEARNSVVAYIADNNGEFDEGIADESENTVDGDKWTQNSGETVTYTYTGETVTYTYTNNNYQVDVDENGNLIADSAKKVSSGSN